MNRNKMKKKIIKHQKQAVQTKLNRFFFSLNIYRFLITLHSL